jgi:hypothetical protein
VPEQLIQHRNVVADQRLFIAVKRGRHLGQNARPVNIILIDHLLSPQGGHR